MGIAATDEGSNRAADVKSLPQVSDEHQWLSASYNCTRQVNSSKYRMSISPHVVERLLFRVCMTARCTLVLALHSMPWVTLMEYLHSDEVVMWLKFQVKGHWMWEHPKCPANKKLEQLSNWKFDTTDEEQQLKY